MDKESGKKGVYGFRGGSRTAATSKMERFVILNNGFQPSNIITKGSILDVSSCWMLTAVNYYNKALHLGYCSSLRFASEFKH